MAYNKTTWTEETLIDVPRLQKIEDGIESLDVRTEGKVIEESGSNENGRFVKYADGTMQCYQSISDLGGVNNGSGAIFRSDIFTWTYPASFIVSPVVNVETTLTNRWASITSFPGISNVSFIYFSTSANDTLTTAFLIALGRWK